jgi:hypothetical protein
MSRESSPQRRRNSFHRSQRPLDRPIIIEWPIATNIRPLFCAACFFSEKTVYLRLQGISG